jgi:hypothetical protein
MRQSRHFVVKRRLTLGQGAVQIEHDRLSQHGISISNTLTALHGRNVHVPVIAGNRSTPPSWMA